MDIGPSAGDKGGRVVASGTPAEIAAASMPGPSVEATLL
jgi:excinuclease UvrABC ATPase subunit